MAREHRKSKEQGKISDYERVLKLLSNYNNPISILVTLDKKYVFLFYKFFVKHCNSSRDKQVIITRNSL